LPARRHRGCTGLLRVWATPRAHHRCCKVEVQCTGGGRRQSNPWLRGLAETKSLRLRAAEGLDLETHAHMAGTNHACRDDPLQVVVKRSPRAQSSACTPASSQPVEPSF